MKAHPSSPALQASVAALLLLGSLPSAAQSAEGFDTSGLVPAEPAPAAKPAVPAAPANPGIDLGPSRFAGDDIQPYVLALSGRFSIRQRATDPFGRYQDPDYKAPEPPRQLAKNPNMPYKAAPPTSFSDIIGAIKVNMNNKDHFIIEGRDRPYRAKDLITMQLPSGKMVKAQVMAVSATRIDFRNLETGETAPLRLEMIPAGMTKGVGPLNTPGVQPSGTDAPLMIQPVTPVSDNP
jgi:hypothetical protein